MCHTNSNKTRSEEIQKTAETSATIHCLHRIQETLTCIVHICVPQEVHCLHRIQETPTSSIPQEVHCLHWIQETPTCIIHICIPQEVHCLHRIQETPTYTIHICKPQESHLSKKVTPVNAETCQPVAKLMTKLDACLITLCINFYKNSGKAELRHDTDHWPGYITPSPGMAW
jgi:hypothetical protein